MKLCTRMVSGDVERGCFAGLLQNVVVMLNIGCFESGGLLVVTLKWGVVRG